MADKEFITTDIAKERTKAINIVAEVTEKGEPRDINLKAGGTTRVCKCTITDPKGTLDLQLWGDEINNVGVKDIIKVLNGYMNEFRGEKSLNVGKFGKLEIVQKAEA